jgi:hypothetical protein
MTAQTYRTGTRMNRGFISADLEAQLVEQDDRFKTRFQEIGRQIADRIGDEAYFMWIDDLPAITDTDSAAMVRAHEAKLAQLIQAGQPEPDDHSTDWQG